MSNCSLLCFREKNLISFRFTVDESYLIPVSSPGNKSYIRAKRYFSRLIPLQTRHVSRVRQRGAEREHFHQFAQAPDAKGSVGDCPSVGKTRSMSGPDVNSWYTRRNILSAVSRLFRSLKTLEKCPRTLNWSTFGTQSSLKRRSSTPEPRRR